MFKTGLKTIYHRLRNVSKIWRRIGLKNTDFSIISNNCTGGYVYQYFGIGYCTPTEGIGLSVDDYLKLIQNPRHYFTHSLKFVNPESTERYRLGEHFTYPAALIDDITVYFRHYPTKEEAENKWKRRSSRINYEKLLFLLSESETMRDEHVVQFCKILSETQKPGFLLTSKSVSGPYVINVLDVPFINNVPQWRPDIVIKSIDWKKELNKL